MSSESEWKSYTADPAAGEHDLMHADGRPHDPQERKNTMKRGIEYYEKYNVWPTWYPRLMREQDGVKD